MIKRFWAKLYAKPVFLLLLAAVLSLPLILPYLHPGYFPTQDGEWAIVRLADMFRELKDHQFPARYSGNLNFGYGYPLFEFAYPFPYYLGILFRILHINFVWSIKLLFLLSVPISFLGMFLASKQLWKNYWVAIFSGVLYIYYPYRLVDLYVRGSIGESLSLALFPFIIYFILQYYEKRKLFSFLMSGIFFGVLIMTHNIMAVEFLPVILFVIACAVYKEKKNRTSLLLNYLFSLFIGLGLSSFFWIPALSETKLIALSITRIANIQEYFVSPMQLLYSPWNYGTKNFSYQLGIVQILFLLGLVLLIFKKSGGALQLERPVSIALFVLAIIYILLLFPFTTSLWLSVPIMKDITYPWTLLAPIGFIIALLAGNVLLAFKNKWFWMIVGCVTILYSVRYAHPSMYVDRGDGFYLTNDATTTSSDEYTPIWVQEKPTQRSYTEFSLPGGKGTVTNAQSNSKSFSATISVPTKAIVQINTIYYPGWQILVDGQHVPIKYTNPKGLMMISVPKGTHAIQGLFKETTLRLISDMISFITLLITAVSLFVIPRKKIVK